MVVDEATFLAPRLFSDEPLEAAEEASFQFDAYARTLAGMIARRDTRAPSTIAVRGRWGTGKTTLMRKVQGLLSNGLKGAGFVPCKTVWFEAWRYQKQNEMFVALTEHILRRIEEDGGFLERFKAKLEDPKQPKLKRGAFFLSAISQVFTLGQVELDLAKYEETSHFKENLAFYDEFQEFLNHLIQQFVSGGRLVVFIDDLDRCIPSKIVQVLEAVKLFLHTPSCVFVLGAATDLVIAAVQAHYEAEHLGGISGREYLDKIIQVQFPLPPIRPDDQEAYIVGLAGIEESTREYLRLVAQTIPTNPRRIKTFLNHVELQWAILVNGGLGERLSKARLVEWLILQDRKPEFCDYFKGLATDQERAQAFREMKRITGRQGAVTLEEGSPLAPFAGDQDLCRIFQLGDFSFDEEAVTLCVHLAPAPTLEATTEVPSVEPGHALTRYEVERAVRERRSLAGANLSGAHLVGADLRRAVLYRADLRDANLEGANLSGAKVVGAFLSKANLQEAIVDAQNIDLSQTRGWLDARWDNDVYRVLTERYGEEVRLERMTTRWSR